MRRPSSILASAIALLLASNALHAADLREVRLTEDDTGTRAVLNLQGGSEYKLFSLANPDRLVIDLPEARLAPGFSLPAPNGAVANVRTGKPVPGTLRIVFDLGAAVASHSRVERDGQMTRLIVELSPRSDAARTKAPEIAGATPVTTAAIAKPLVPALSQASITPANVPITPLPAEPKPFVTKPAPTSDPIAAITRLPAQTMIMPAKTLQDVIGTSQRKLVVAIDAGHGGKDPGALGPSGVREKAITLAVARELAKQINADPGMKAVLIRDSDSFVPLKQRYMKARAAQADLFISIHADASPNNTASGASVFVLSTRGASSQAARWLADQENAADLVGGVSLDQKDPNLAAVLLDLSQSATMRASDDIAGQVLTSLKNVGKAHKPAIERANFVVLRSPDVPSMLIETGFITNPSEEQRLNDGAYRARLAAAITDGVRKYFLGQPPAGSWYASRQGDSSRDGENLAPMVASSPE
jgi:N-acetylmuramoyl-L-alanine amidase